MSVTKKDQIRALLKCIETGETGPVAVVNEDKYIQHNPQTQEGSEGLAALFQRLSKTNPKVNTVRAFEDGDFVFAHTEYDFSRRNIGFEVFRFEEGRAVEHWDNIQARLGPNQFGHSMVDGPCEAIDLEHTEKNRSLVRSFLETVLIGGQFDQLTAYVNEEVFVEHNPGLRDEMSALCLVREASDQNITHIAYHRLHRVLAEGNFVLGVCEGQINDTPSAFYDQFRIADGKIVEHWDTTEKIAPRTQWKNNNGKF